MKLTASGVTLSAAIIRSPSFSRSSSSTMMIRRPSWISSRASSMLANCIWFYERLNVLGNDVIFEIDGITSLSCSEVGVLQCVRNYCDRKQVVSECRNRQADPIDSDRALIHNVAGRRLRKLDFQVPAVTVTIETKDSSNA